MKNVSFAPATRVLALLLGSLALVNCGTSTKLDKIVVTPANPSLAKGTNLQFTATGNYSDGSTQDLTQSVAWQTNPASVATIDDQGQAKAMGEGASQVSAIYQRVTGSTYLTIGAPALVAIAVTPSPSSLPLGESEQLSATGKYSDGSTQNLTQSVAWASSGTGIASISPTGSVLATGAGTAAITAVSGSITGTASVTVGQAALLSITVSPNPSSLPLGESEQLTATGNFSDGSTQDLTQSAAWASSGAGTAAVSGAGSVLAKGAGTATINATSGTVTGGALVTVGQAALLGISVSPNPSSLPLGESEQLTATGKFSDGSTQDLTQSVNWSSSGTGIASVSAAGSVLAKGGGTATISAALGSASGSASVIVGPAALLGITVAPSQSSLPVGESEQLTATGNYSDGSAQNLTQTVAWTSSGSATVSPAGMVLAGAVGTATINAAMGSLNGSAALTVTPAVVVSLDITPATLSVVLQTSRQLQAVATWSDGTSQDVTATASWSATPAGFASFSSSGVVTAQQVGTTTIFATYSGTTGTSTVTVTPLLYVNYFNRANAQASGTDSFVRFTNPGLTAGTPTAGNLCAMVYVFDTKEELNECCGCFVSDSGYRELSLLNDLTANPLTGVSPNAGVVMVIPSDIGSNPQCNPGTPSPQGALAGWETNNQSNGDGTYQVTETSFYPVPLAGATQASLANLCSMVQIEGSGQGICSCGSGGR